MISVAEATAHVLSLGQALGVEEVPLDAAAGRYLARPLLAKRDQPPFPSSAMDGYAVSGRVAPGDRLRVIGEAAAGARFAGSLEPGQAVRIFTGAPVPTGGTRIVIQEDVTREGDHITLSSNLDDGPYIRPAGGDFRKGTPLDPCWLSPDTLALAASMGYGRVPVGKRPKVAVISTGDELVAPGDLPGPDQIVASNSVGLAALFRAAGAEVSVLPIARDTQSALRSAFYFAQPADLIVTSGGASVGDHDLVGTVAADLGLERSFYKIAMRPGKPLMAGRLGDAAMLGLPGNPVSALVCGRLFAVPLIRGLQGDDDPLPKPRSAPLASDLNANGPRAHYMRATLSEGALHVAPRQDSALLSVLAGANVLAIRPPHDPARRIGDTLDYLFL